MPIVDVVNLSNEKVGEVELPDEIFSVPLKPHLVHEVVTAQLHSKRAGTACTKGRGELSYSTRKPYSQKKTGRARAGSRRSPLWRGGGTIFGPKPRDFGWRPPAKIRRQALKVVLTAKLMESQLTILDRWPAEAPKTRDLVAAAKGLGLVKKTPNKRPCNRKDLTSLVVLGSSDANLELSSRNVPYLDVILAQGLNCYDILRHDRLVILQESLPLIEERLLK